jgi:hypothetical protein
MSIFNILRSASIVAVGAVVGFKGMQYWQASANQERSIASLAPTRMIAKIGLEQNANNMFDIRVDDGGVARHDGSVSTLKIYVQAYNAVPEGLSANWKIPHDVDVVSGDLNLALGAFQRNEIKTFSLQVKNFSKDVRKYISFEIFGSANQLPVRRDVLLSSRVEDSFEYIVQQNEAQKTKALQKLGQSKSKSKFDPENVAR